MPENKLAFVLQLADNALILGHRISEWCGHGPILEQDIALTNIALDHLGQARSLFQYAADLYNALPKESQKEFISSPLLQQQSTAATEDSLAYLRDSWDFRNVLLTEQPNQDWAFTIARSFYYDHYAVLFYSELSKSTDLRLAAIAEKSLKEVQYHQRWSSEWVIRLGDGTTESKQKMQTAIEELWPYTGELFATSDAEKAVAQQLHILPLEQLKTVWEENTTAVLNEATLTTQDSKAWMQSGGKEGRHSEHLGYILAEMQYMQRAYPNMEW